MSQLHGVRAYKDSTLLRQAHVDSHLRRRLDGRWIEGITGWAIGEDSWKDGDRPKVVSSLYDKLEQVVIPLFYGARERFLEVMLHAIALNGSFFNTHRMMQQYVKAYF
jgi:starch phosphorylase